MADTDHVEAAVLAAYDRYAPSVSEEIADRCALAFREGFLAGHAEAESELRAENERLRAGLQDALAAIDWMFAAQQPLRDPWFAHRDALIARARAAFERHSGA